MPFWSGGLTLLAAAPGVGKTSWMLRMIAEAAANNVPAAIGCYEHTPEELAFRLRSQATGRAIGPHGSVTSPTDQAAVDQQVALWSTTVLLELSDREDTVRMLEDTLVHHYAFPECGPALLAVDYLQRVPVVNIGGIVPEEQRAGEAAAALRSMSRRREWAIVAASATKAGSFDARDAGLGVLLGDERVPYEADRVIWVTPELIEDCGCARWRVDMLKDRTDRTTAFPMVFWGERFYPHCGKVIHSESGT